MKTLEEVKQQLIMIKDMGFVKTHRAHDTGVGKTLEDLLGISENNISLPDIGEIELKSQRIDTGSMLTVATKAPQPKGANRNLYEAYCYLDKEGDLCLHSTAYGSKPNNLGFQLIFVSDRLVLDNPKKIPAYWPMSIFDDVLKSKSGRILIVFAETRGERKTLNEYFHYTEAHLLSGLNINKFEAAIRNDKMKVDTRIGTYKSGRSKGKYHDHGTGFRINKTNFLQLFDSYQQII
jgi:hypothetical protein